MPGLPHEGDAPDPAVADDLQELAARLHEADHLTPRARAQVASLLGELAEELDRPESSDQDEELARITSRLVRAVKERHEPGMVDSARESVEAAVARAESKAPVATDIVLRLIDALAGAGI